MKMLERIGLILLAIGFLGELVGLAFLRFRHVHPLPLTSIVAGVIGSGARLLFYLRVVRGTRAAQIVAADVAAICTGIALLFHVGTFIRVWGYFGVEETIALLIYTASAVLLVMVLKSVRRNRGLVVDRRNERLLGILILVGVAQFLAAGVGVTDFFHVWRRVAGVLQLGQIGFVLFWLAVRQDRLRRPAPIF